VGPITLVAGRVWDAAKNVSLAAEAAQGWRPGAVYLAGQTASPESGGHAHVPPPLQALGYLERDALDDWLARADVYLAPARYDPFGLLPVQAALHGCALLLSDIPSYRELWDGAACFFRSDDADDLRRLWQRLLDQPGDLAQRARERALICYTPARMATAYATLYQHQPVLVT
jgi:glycosyltransferase involved in cell wall biosynthesis